MLDLVDMFGNAQFGFNFSPTRLACGVLTVKKGYRLGYAERAVPPSPRTGSPKDLGTKILVPTETESLRGGASQKLSRGARGAAGPLPGGLGSWKPPRNSRGSATVKTILWTQIQRYFVPKSILFDFPVPCSRAGLNL